MENKLNGKTALIYARVSTKQQDLKVQVAQCKKAIVENGMIMAGKPREEKVSGAADYRAELERIISEDPIADVLVIRELSRISREEDYLDALEKMRQIAKKYSIYIVADNYYIEKTPIIELSDGIQLIIKLFAAADEREKIKMRQATAKRAYREESCINFIGAPKITYGMSVAENPNYIKGKNSKKIWVPDQEKWPTIELLFNMKAIGKSFTEISAATGLPWATCRCIYWLDYVRHYIDPVIVEKGDEWNRKLDKSPRPSKHENVYKDKIFDGLTGLSLNHKVETKADYYQSKDKKSGCIRKSTLDRVMFSTLYDFVYFFNLQGEDLRKENEQKIKAINEQLEVFKVEEGNVLRMKKKYTNDWISTEIQAIRDELEKKIKDLEKREKDIAKFTKQKENELKRLQRIDYSKETVKINEDSLRSFLERYVDEIRCFNAGKGKMNLEIHFYSQFIPTGFKRYRKVYVDSLAQKGQNPTRKKEPFISDVFEDDEKLWWSKDGTVCWEME